MDSEILKKAETWTTDLFDEQTRSEIRALLDQGDEPELSDRFYRDLEFGTGGMRGIMSAGTNRMNLYTVGRATQGLADFLLNENEDPEEARSRGVTIAYDSRINSQSFAREAARVLAANGIRVNLFTRLRPTPLLSYAVRELNSIAGIVITASHNPKEYNGYKVYGPDGGQVIAPADQKIVEYVGRVDMARGVKRIDYEKGAKQGIIRELDDRVERSYLEELGSFIHKLERGLDEVSGSGREVTVVYTPLHGTGITLVPEAVKATGGKVRLVCEESQSEPDGSFPTVESPNPENHEALIRAIQLAESEQADMVIATDPDSDRLGVAVPGGSGRFVTLSGNQLGCLFAWMIATSYQRSGLMPSRPVIISTIVSTEMVHAIADSFGVQVMEVLTGFKFIARRMLEFQKSGTPNFIYGFEESYGYLAGTFVRDKDGVMGAILAMMLLSFCMGGGGAGAAAGSAAGSAAGTGEPDAGDAAGREAGSGSTTAASPVLGLLDKLYRKFGLFMEFQHSVMLKGMEGARRIQRIMADLRENPPAELGGGSVYLLKDFQEQKIRHLQEDRETDITDLPRSNVLQFYAGDLKVSVRPSGTEPKIKFYFALKKPVEGTVESGRKELEDRFKTVRDEVLARCGLDQG
jgi:phosphoglucomutase